MEKPPLPRWDQPTPFMLCPSLCKVVANAASSGVTNMHGLELAVGSLMLIVGIMRAGSDHIAEQAALASALATLPLEPNWRTLLPLRCGCRSMEDGA